MRRCTAATARLLGMILASTNADARGPYGSIGVGNWKGGAFTSDATGEFTSCSAFSPYKSGITVYVIVGANMTWRLGFSSESWKLTTGQNFPIVLTFDGQQPFNVYAAVIGPNLVGVDMPDNSSLINQFRKSKSMSAFTQGHLFQFDMRGTSALLPTLVNCVAKTKSLGVANVGDFSVVLPSKQAVKPVVATAPAGTPSDTNPDKLFDQSGVRVRGEH
jgi:hypothetical protein